MREPTEQQAKMLGTYERDMMMATPRLPDETDLYFVRRASKEILAREGIPHFLCRRCWQWHHRETVIYWPGICDPCDSELKGLNQR
jgi:hypothetical protein